MIRRFNRYELKYVIDARRYRRVVEDLRQFMVPDAYGDQEGFYRIVSLYYDSPGLSAYHSKLDGLLYRRKLRLRIYPPGGDVTRADKGLIEIKQRINRTVQKRRLVLPLAEAEALCAGDPPARELDELDAAVASEVQFMVRAQRLRPAAIVSYRRQAFMAERYDSGMRVTFDMQLQGRTTSLKVNEDAKNHYVARPDRFVMEVKVNERVPHWITALLARHECVLQRVSKYCAVISNEHRRLETALELRKEEPWMI